MVVAAAGNSAADSCSWYYNPDTTLDKLLVGSTTNSDDASYFSNFGACVHVQVSTPRLCPPEPTRACSPASGRPPPAHPLPHEAPAARVRRPLAPTSRERGLAQATPPPTPSAAPAWQHRMSRASPPRYLRRARRSWWRESRRCSSPPRRWTPSPFLQAQFSCKRPTASSLAAPESGYS